jgi:hypothetical protein
METFEEAEFIMFEKQKSKITYNLEQKEVYNI